MSKNINMKKRRAPALWITSEAVGLKVYSESDVPVYRQNLQNYNLKVTSKSFQMW
jgi:hypothetical protein